MAWIWIAAAAYLFGAGANILDKFLLGSKRISSAPVYAFYIGLFGLTAFMFAPFGLSVPSAAMLSLCFFSGALFLLGITLLYFGLVRSEAGRIMPVVGAVIPLVTFAIAMIFKSDSLSLAQISGMVLLIFGGLLISFDLPLQIGKKKFFAGFPQAVAAGVVMAMAYVMFKHISASESFVTWYIWTRVGGTIGIGFLLLVPAWRNAIFRSFTAAKKNRSQTVSTGGIFVSNKIIGGLSTLCLNYAIGLGSVTLVNAMVSLQYVFLLGMLWLVSKKYHRIFQEKLLFWDWAQKVVAIVIIGIGVYFVSGI